MADRRMTGAPGQDAGPEPDGGAEAGRGLGLVDALATRWASRRDGAGTVTWFEISF